MTGKTFISREISSALNRRGYDIVTEHFLDLRKDSPDTVYVETQFGAIIRIDVSEVQKNENGNEVQPEA